MTLSDTELALIDRWQRNFPLVEHPFAEVGHSVGLDEEQTIHAFARLNRAGVLSRIGAVVRPNSVGVSTLAAMRVPPEAVEAVADVVSREALVNHNYERDHAFNLWFVIAAPGPEGVANTIESIERRTGLTVLALPLVKAYHVDLGFSLRGGAESRRNRSVARDDYEADPLDRQLLGAIEDGLPITAEPFRAVAEALGVDHQIVLDRLRHLTASGIVTRFGCVVRHRALGFNANAMVVWDIPDAQVDAAAAHFTAHPRVTLCYRRPRRLPDWPYNLFCMIHAKAREDARGVVDDLNKAAGTRPLSQAILFSTRCFKQQGARFAGNGAMH